MKDRIEVKFNGIKITIEKISGTGEAKRTPNAEIETVGVELEKGESIASSRPESKEDEDQKGDQKKKEALVPVVPEDTEVPASLAGPAGLAGLEATSEELKFADFCNGKTAREIRDRILDNEEISRMESLLSELYAGDLLGNLVKKGLLVFRNGRYYRKS